MEDVVKSHLVALELQLQDPVTRKDARAVDELLSDDFREFGASGRVWERAEILAALAEDAPQMIVSADFECRLLANDLALLTYISITPSRKALRSSWWRREGDRWRLVFHQGTHIPNE